MTEAKIIKDLVGKNWIVLDMEKRTLAMKIEIILVLVIQHRERQAKKNTNIYQSQKVEQTTDVRYYPQYTNNLEEK